MNDYYFCTIDFISLLKVLFKTQTVFNLRQSPFLLPYRGSNDGSNSNQRKRGQGYIPHAHPLLENSTHKLNGRVRIKYTKQV